MTQRFAAILSAGDAIRQSLFGSKVWARSFPSQPVRFISPFPTGSGPDVIARTVTERLGASWKQPVEIDAEPGDNGFLAAGMVKKAAPTGYELLIADVGHLSISPSVFKNLPYDPKADFAPIGGLYRTSLFIMVGAKSPIHSVKDLIAAAVAKRGKITYGSSSVAGPQHLGAAQVEAVTGTNMLHVPFQEYSALYQAVSTGEVDWVMGSLAGAGSLLRAGKLRLVAIADNVRSTVFPDIPTFEQSGGRKNVMVRSWVVVMAPKRTPVAVVMVLNRSLANVFEQPEVIEKFASLGIMPFTITPAALASFIENETIFYAHMVRRTGANTACADRQ